MLNRLEVLERLTFEPDGFQAMLRSEYDRLLSEHGDEESVRKVLGVRLLVVVDEDPPGGDEMAVWAVESLYSALERSGYEGK